jgi:hypothetical protein
MTNFPNHNPVTINVGRVGTVSSPGSIPRCDKGPGPRQPGPLFAFASGQGVIRQASCFSSFTRLTLVPPMKGDSTAPMEMSASSISWAFPDPCRPTRPRTSPNQVEFGFHGAWLIGVHRELQLGAGHSVWNAFAAQAFLLDEAILL